MLTVIRNGRSYEVPAEVEAKSGPEIEAWLQAAEAQLLHAEEAPAAEGRSKKRAGDEEG